VHLKMKQCADLLDKKKKAIAAYLCDPKLTQRDIAKLVRVLQKSVSQISQNCDGESNWRKKTGRIEKQTTVPLN
jgi:predicted XRE-type DNA-binding protein